VVLYLLWSTVPPFIKWAFIDSLWFSTSDQCKASDGACWSIITANIRFILFGFYPTSCSGDRCWRWSSWCCSWFSAKTGHWRKSLLYAWLFGLFTMGLLLKGGLFGLESSTATTGAACR
jgi:general L-amino acid transport system permease protein